MSTIETNRSWTNFRVDRRNPAAKNLINQVSLPSADRLLDALNSFQSALHGVKRNSESKLC